MRVKHYGRVPTKVRDMLSSRNGTKERDKHPRSMANSNRQRNAEKSGRTLGYTNRGNRICVNTGRKYR